MIYAITARKTVKPITKEHYHDYLSKIGDLGSIGNVNFEAKKGLHCHFVLEVKGKINYKELRPTKRGWNVKAVPIYSYREWSCYSRKDRELECNDDPDLFVPPKKRMF